jgi:hypothetical protein
VRISAGVTPSNWTNICVGIRGALQMFLNCRIYAKIYIISSKYNSLSINPLSNLCHPSVFSFIYIRKWIRDGNIALRQILHFAITNQGSPITIFPPF